MPSTVNGIGTTYFGKRNRRQHDGVCQFCQRPAKLENYETRLVFSVFFIPLLPLAKKQILNYCPYCTRHVAVPYSAWQQAQQEAVAASAAELARTSHDPDAAIRMHATYDTYQMNDDAARFADAMLALYGDIARVQFYLGGWFERAGRRDQADAAFARALELEPGNVLFQRAVAIGHIRDGRLDQAQRMLEPFKPPSEAYEPPLFLLLARGYQEQQRHIEAMDLFKMVGATRSDVLKDRSFRNAVRRSERALGATQSLVGREPFYRSRALLVAAGALALLLALLGSNYYVRTHRRLYVVNGLQVPLTVKIDDGLPQSVPQQGHVLMRVAEGKHVAAVAAPELGNPPVEFEVASPWFTGLFRSPAFVIDPSRSAAVTYQEVTYAPRGDAAPPGRQELHVGEAFLSFPDIDYPFESFPQEVKLKGRQPVRKTHISLMPLPPERLVMLAAVLPGVADKALPLAEVHLRAVPDSQMLLAAYWGLAVKQGQRQRCDEFLATRLADRPVRVDWHRIWQSVRQDQGDGEKLVEQYDAWLAADPTNSALLYLRGRCDPDTETALSYYQRAISADAANAYPRLAQAVVWQGRGEFHPAREAAGEALRLKPQDVQMGHVLNQLRFALREFADLDRELRSAIAAEPYSPFALAEHEQLLAVLVAAGKTAEAEQHVDSFSQQAAAQHPEQEPAWTRQLRLTLLYLEGKFDDLLAATAPPLDPTEVGVARYRAQFELGQLDAPPPDVMGLDDGQEGFGLLCQALAWSERGDAAAASAARAKAVELLAKGRDDNRKTAAVLAKSGELTQNDLDHLSHDTRLKTIALVALAENHPKLDTRLLDLAEKLNFDRRFPYHFLQRTIRRLRESDTVEADGAEPRSEQTQNQ